MLFLLYKRAFYINRASGSSDIYWGFWTKLQERSPKFLCVQNLKKQKSTSAACRSRKRISARKRRWGLVQIKDFFFLLETASGGLMEADEAMKSWWQMVLSAASLPPSPWWLTWPPQSWSWRYLQLSLCSLRADTFGALVSELSGGFHERLFSLLIHSLITFSIKCFLGFFFN